MARKRKAILAYAAAFVALLVVAAIGVAVLIDVDRYRPRLEAAASDALGMEVRIAGGLRLALSPPFGVAAEDVHVRHREVDLLRARTIRVGLRLLPLLRREVRIAELRLAAPSFDLRRRGTGRLDFDRYVETPLRRSRELLPGILSGIGRVVLADGVVVYSNAESGNRVSMEGVDVTLRDLALEADRGPGSARRASFTGTVDVGKAESQGLAATGVRAQVRAAGGVLAFDPVSMTVFGGTAAGSVRLDASGEAPLVEARISIPGFRIEEAIGGSSKQPPMRGTMALAAEVSARGTLLREMMETLRGEVSLTGSDLALPSADLDRTLETSRGGAGVDLARAAALLLWGPAAGALAREGQTGGASAVTGGQGALRELVSDWRVADGVAEARDVALATENSRIALRGALDLANGRFDRVTVALLDDKGCAVLRREIGGTFGEPEVGKPIRGKATAGAAPPSPPGAGKAAAREGCAVFYSGSVAAPQVSGAAGP